MRQRKSKIVLIYFLLLIILGSINNSSLSKIKFDKVKKIYIHGLNHSDNQIILNNIKNLNLESIFFLDGNAISKVINANALVEKYKVFKKYPSSIDIDIKKTNLLANINKNGSTFIIGSNGKLIKNNLSKNDIPFIFGNPNTSEFLSFKEIIDDSNISFNQIKYFYFFKSKRWDIVLSNDILIKLSENNIKDSLNNAHEFLNNVNFKNIKVIDARIKNQIILND